MKTYWYYINDNFFAAIYDNGWLIAMDNTPIGYNDISLGILFYEPDDGSLLPCLLWFPGTDVK